MTEFAFLLDENVEPEVGQKLRREGHDVAHVVEVSALGPGSPVSDVQTHAAATGRTVVTYDDHFTDPDDDGVTVFYCPNQAVEAFDLFRIITAIAEAYETQDAVPPVVFASENWL